MIRSIAVSAVLLCWDAAMTGVCAEVCVLPDTGPLLNRVRGGMVVANKLQTAHCRPQAGVSTGVKGGSAETGAA